MEFIFDYMKRYKNVSFKEKAFNEVDALILSQFSYMKWKGVIPKLTEKEKNIPLLKMKNVMDEEKVFCDPWFGKKNQLLFRYMLSGKRFREMECNYFADIINEEMETQFCAFVCFLKGSFPVVLFQGTDETLIGWKEDFQLVLSTPALAQCLAALYLNQVAKKMKGKFIVCGHSKGGNLAIYSSMHIKDIYVKKIKRIYSFDGPGFRKELLQTYGYIRIKNRIRRYIPKSAVIGMLLNGRGSSRVVKCKGWGFFQHNPYLWGIHDDHFVRVFSVRMKRRICYQAFNNWLMNVPEEEIEAFADILFDLIRVNNDKTTYTWAQNWRWNVAAMCKAAKKLDKCQKKHIFHVLWRLILL